MFGSQHALRLTTPCSLSYAHRAPPIAVATTAAQNRYVHKSSSRSVVVGTFRAWSVSCSAEQGYRRRPPRMSKPRPARDQRRRSSSSTGAKDRPMGNRTGRDRSRSRSGADSTVLRDKGEPHSNKGGEASGDEPVRLNKLMAQRGLCSRREADRYLENGDVLVDGLVVTEMGAKFPANVDVKIVGRSAAQKEAAVSVLMHKPYSFISHATNPKPRQRFARDLLTMDNKAAGCEYPGQLPAPARLKGLSVAGRLDADSSGALIFSQCGQVKKAIISGQLPIDKEYIVTVSGHLQWREREWEEAVERLRHGIHLDDRPLKPAEVEWINDEQLRFTLRQGRFRQIRRMCEDVGLRVEQLQRVRIGHLALGRLRPGQWTTFTLQDLVGDTPWH